jgi:hypothetical protein
MHLSSRLLMLVLLLSFGIIPASAQPAPAAGAAWPPGFYAGWISFSARIDTDVTWGAGSSSLTGFVIEKYEGKGQLMVKIDAQGAGGASIVLPTSINLLDYAKATTPDGSCTVSSSIVAQTNYVHFKGAAAAMSGTFQVPINLVAGISYKSQHGSSFGELKICDQAGSKNLEAMKIAMRKSTGEIQTMEFTAGDSYNTGDSIGGTCTIPGWVKTTPIPGATGQGVRSLPSCNWRLFKTGQPNQQKGWK